MAEEAPTAGEGEQQTEEEPAPKRKRRSRWGDVEGETDRDLMTLRAAEEERLARADRDQKAYAEERALITRVVPPEDPSTLPEEERVLLSAEQAAIKVLKEAIEFDPVSSSVSIINDDCIGSRVGLPRLVVLAALIDTIMAIMLLQG